MKKTRKWVELRAVDVEPELKRKVQKLADKEDRTESAQIKVMLREWFIAYGEAGL